MEVVNPWPGVAGAAGVADAYGAAHVRAGAQRRSRRIAAPDGLIAATARHHGLPVMTRNVSDFTPAGVEVVNPWLD